MHLPDGFLTLPVSASLIGASALAVGAASRRAQQSLTSERLPLLGVLGGFVFAAQLLNFPLPMVGGVSGHLTGGALVAIALGPAPAILAMTSVVVVQCLLMADGGLLALGANVMNLAIVAPLSAWVVHRALGDRWVGVAAAASVLAAAISVSLQLFLSGAIPISTFLLPMLGLHAVIAAVEGAATHVVMKALRGRRPDLFAARLRTS